nr:polyprotein [Maculavirus vitis]
MVLTLCFHSDRDHHFLSTLPLAEIRRLAPGGFSVFIPEDLIPHLSPSPSCPTPPLPRELAWGAACNPTNFPHLFRHHHPSPPRTRLTPRPHPPTPAPSSAPILPRVFHGGAPPAAFQPAIDFLHNTIQKDTIASSIIAALNPSLTSSLTLYPYALPARWPSALNHAGIPATSYGHQSHPHPIHKTIETHLLHEHWANRATLPSTVMFMKRSKFDKLCVSNAALVKSASNFLHLLNPILTARDADRYTHLPLPDALPSTPLYFMHDALMYFSPSQIAGLFLAAPSLERLYASLVLPAESTIGSHPFFPSMYRYRTTGEHLHYVLEGNPSSSYTQPLTATQWLTTSSITAGDLHLTVTVLESWFSVHSILITRGVRPLELPRDIISLPSPDAVLLPNPSAFDIPLRSRLVPRDVCESLFVYVRAVRTLRTTDPSGFIRTQSNKAEFDWVTAEAWDHLAQFALLTAPVRPNTYFLPLLSPLAIIRHWLFRKQRPIFATLTLISASTAAAIPYAIARLRTHSVTQLTILGHHFTPPKILARLPVALKRLIPKRLLPHLPSHLRPPPSWSPVFTLTFSELPKARFLTFPISGQTHTLLRKLHVPSILFAPQRPSRPLILAGLLIGTVPVLYGAYRWLVSRFDPQTVYNRYSDLLHRPTWHLTFEREPLSCHPTPFLPHPCFHPRRPRRLPPLPPAPPAPPQPPPPPPPQPSPHPPLFPASTPSPPPRPSSPPPPATSPASTPALTPIPAPKTAPPLTFPSPTLVAEPSPPVTAASSPLPLAPSRPFSELYPGQYADHSGSFFLQQPLVASTVPYPTLDCLLVSCSAASGIPKEDLWATLCHIFPPHDLVSDLGLSTNHLTALAFTYQWLVTLRSGDLVQRHGLLSAPFAFEITHTPPTPPATVGHFALSAPLTPTSAKRRGGEERPVISGPKASASLPRARFGPCPEAPRPPLNPPGFTPITEPTPATSPFALAALRFRLNRQPLPVRQVHSYSISLPRAKNLVSNLKNGFDGLVSSLPASDRTNLLPLIQALDHTADFPPARPPVGLIHLAGFAGCGKSYPVQQLLATQTFRHFRVVTPTTELRHEWKRALKLEGPSSWRVSTWETALAKRASVLVIDEVYKLPRGYLDLALLADPTVEFVIILGDPLQGSYNPTNPDSSNHRLTPEEDHLRRYIDFYCLWTRRLPRLIADFFGVPTTNPTRGHLAFASLNTTQSPLLVPSDSMARALTAGGHRAITYAASQGSTYPAPVHIFLDRNSNLVTNHVALVALTRSRSGVHFLPRAQDLPRHPQHLFTAFYKYAIDLLAHEADPSKPRPTPVDVTLLFQQQLRGLTILRDPSFSRITGGATHATLARAPLFTQLHGLRPTIFPDNRPTAPTYLARPAPLHQPESYPTSALPHRVYPASATDWSAADDHPRVNPTFVAETRLPLQSELAPTLPSQPEPSPTYHSPATFETVYPGVDGEALARTFLAATDPLELEIFFRNNWSNQFPFINRPDTVACNPLTLVAPTHNQKQDPTLLHASLAKRLRFRDSTAPYAITAKDQALGYILYHSLQRAYCRSPEPVPFDPVLFASCIAENDFAQLTSKTQATIQANAFRSDPDWRHTFVRIFSKTQHKVNENSLFTSWKACQTLALMHDYLILVLGPVKKYQRILDSRDRPPHLYIHAGQTPHQLSEWCQAHLTPSVHLANDYTAFDQSQHGEAVVLEAWKMRRASIPEPFISLHVHVKTNIECQFGPLTCMRITGEPGTYDDNTDYNLAILYTQYHLHRTPVLVSGDDSLVDRVPPMNPSWPALAPLFALKPKPETSPFGLFCGYFVGPAGAVRAPRALFAKLAIALEDGSLPEKIASYVAEFSVGQSLGDALWSLIPPELVIYQSACFDLICRHASPQLKLALRLGEVPDWGSLLSQLKLRFLTRPLFALLDAHTRVMVRTTKAHLLPSGHALHPSTEPFY